MKHSELKGVIKCIHRIWYEGDPFGNPSDAIELHRHMSALFNYADIKSTLCKNNPDKITPQQFEEQYVRQSKRPGTTEEKN